MLVKFKKCIKQFGILTIYQENYFTELYVWLKFYQVTDTYLL